VKGRIIRIAVVLVFVGLGAWIASRVRFESMEVPSGLQGEAAHNPFYGAIRFSEALGAEATWERVFATPRTDAVIMLSSWNWTLSRSRRESIEHWVESGGRLIVDNSLAGASGEFATWSGIDELESEPEEEQDTPDSTEESGTDEAEQSDPDVDESPSDEDSFMSSLGRIKCNELSEDGSNRRIDVCGLNQSRSLKSSRPVLWALRDGERIHALRTAVGRGSVTVINAAPFRFKQFLDGDHPRLFATMAQLHHDDLVLFFTEEEQASLISLMWRFGAPAVLLILACVALALWRSIPRFGPRVGATQSARRSLAEQIRGTGLFALRFGNGKALHAASVRALRDAAIRGFPGYDRMSGEERVTTLARASGVNAEDLGPAMSNTGLRTSHELRNAIAVLETARRRLTKKKANHGN